MRLKYTIHTGFTKVLQYKKVLLFINIGHSILKETNNRLKKNSA